MLEILMSGLHFYVLELETVIGSSIKPKITKNFYFMKVKWDREKIINLILLGLTKKDSAIITPNSSSQSDSFRNQAIVL